MNIDGKQFKVSHSLQYFVYPFRVHFEIIVDQDIPHSGHTLNSSGEIGRKGSSVTKFPQYSNVTLRRS